MIDFNVLAAIVKRNYKLAIIILALATVLMVYLVLRGTDWFRPLDMTTEQALAQFPLPTQAKFRKLFNAWLKHGYRVTVTSGVRKAGSDPHTRKHACDVNLECIATGEKFMMATSKEKWLATGCPQIAIEMDFRWGGNFHTPYLWNGTMHDPYDPVHFDTE